MAIAEKESATLPANHPRSPSESPPSGVRASTATVAARVEAALASSAQTEAALADIFRTAKFLSATVKAVRDANAELRRELIELQASASRDRELLVADQDEFIAMLLEDHERELKALLTQLSQAETQSGAGDRIE